MESSSMLVVVVAAVISALAVRCLWVMVEWVWLQPKRVERQLRRQGLTGNPYRLLFGDVKDSGRMRVEARSRPIGLHDDPMPRLMPFVHQTIKNYGKKSFMWLGPKLVVFVTDPEHVKEIMLKMGDYPKPNSSNPLVRLLAQGIVIYEGEKWSVHRKILNPAFHIDKLKLMLPVFNSTTREMVERLEEVVSMKGPCEVDVWPHLQRLTRDMISRTAFGSSFEEGSRIFELQQEQTILVMKLLQSVYIPGWRYLPTEMNSRMKSIAGEVQTVLRGIIHKKLKALRTGEASPSDDMLGLLLESNMNEIRENDNQTGKKGGMSIDDVVEECKLFYFAGQETTTSLLVWTLFLLSIHPEWQHRAREEVLHVFGDRKPDNDGLNHLKIMTMIVHEVLRLYTPGVELMRKVDKETKLGNLTIPSGVQLLLPTILLHRDPEIWGKDAKEFRPERFAEGILKATKGNQMAYFPFGWGPRICIGQNFALIEAKVALAMILQRFSFELSPTYAHAPVHIMTVQPQHGLQLILRRNQ